MASRQDIQTLQERVRTAIKTLAELKRNVQAMGGDSWQFYRRLIKPAWDFEVHGITSTSYYKRYKVTYNVERPDTGFALFFMDYEFDDNVAQNMSFNSAAVKGDPYSIWLVIKHVTYTSDPGGISVRFNVFAPQRGTITLTEM